MTDSSELDNHIDISTNPSPDNLDKIEADLLEAAHQETMAEDATQRVVGRCLKQIIPAYIAWLKAEIDRDEDGGPGRCVAASARSFASLAGIVTVLASKGDEKLIKRAAGLVGGVFVQDIQEIVDRTRRVDNNASESTH